MSMCRWRYSSKFDNTDIIINASNEIIIITKTSFSYIDQGRNPQLYTKDCIEKALTKNEQVKGKIDAYRKFKANMLVELNRVFPNELAKYRAIRGDEQDKSKFKDQILTHI